MFGNSPNHQKLVSTQKLQLNVWIKVNFDYVASPKHTQNSGYGITCNLSSLLKSDIWKSLTNARWKQEGRPIYTREAHKNFAVCCWCGPTISHSSMRDLHPYHQRQRRENLNRPSRIPIWEPSDLKLITNPCKTKDTWPVESALTILIENRRLMKLGAHNWLSLGH